MCVLHTMCVKQIASGKLLYSTESLARCSGMRSGIRGCGREAQEGEGICIYLQLFHTVVQKELRQHCKAIILQLKKHNLSNSLNLVRGSDCLID